METDVIAGLVLARAAAGLADATITSDVVNLEQIRVWFGRPLWGMEPAPADRVLRHGEQQDPARTNPRTKTPDRA